MNIFVDHKEAAAEFAHRRQWQSSGGSAIGKRTEEMQHNARGYDVKFSGS